MIEVEDKEKLIESLITLLGDEDGAVVETARNKLLEIGAGAIPILRDGLKEQPVRTRLRLRQIIEWMKTDPLNKHLPPAKKAS